MNTFLPPVLFEIKANATQAYSTFHKVNAELAAMEKQALKTGKAIGVFEKTAIVGTKALKVLGLTALAVGALSVKSAMEVQKSYNRLGQALSAMGVSTEENRKQIAILTDNYERLGFAGERAADAYSVLITATGDVAKSNHMLATAADLARARNLGLEESARLLVRAQAGNARLFTQFGIVLDNTKPKAQAVAEAMKQLEARLGGQAQAYTKTFAGQIAILNESLGNLFETIGYKLIVVLNKFIEKLNGAGKFIKDHNELIIGLASAITIALIPAIVNLTRSLVTMGVTLAKSPLGRVAIVLGLITTGFVKAWNASETFRKVMVKVVNFVITGAQAIVEAVFTIANAFLLLERAGANVKIAMGKLFNKEGWVKSGKEVLDSIDKTNAGYQRTIDRIEGIKKSVDKLTNKKLKLNLDFTIPTLPDYGNGTGGKGGLGGLPKAVADAVINALQRIADFNTKVKDTMTSIMSNWKSVFAVDFKKTIEEQLLNPTDKLIVQTNKAISSYNTANASYATAMRTLKEAQQAYTDAIKGTNKVLIASSESALKRAEENVNSLQKTMESATSDLMNLQEQMIAAVVDATNQIRDLQQQRAQIVSDGYAQEQQAYKDYLTTKAKLEKDYNANVAQAQKEAAARSADIIKQSIDLLRNAYSSATGKSIGDVYSSLTFGGLYTKGGSVSALSNALKTQLDKAKKLSEDAAALSGKGFTQTFIQQVISQGVDIGHALAQEILQSSPESVTELNNYWKELDKQTQHGVDSLAQTLNTTTTLATEELTQQLAQVQIDLNDQLKTYQVDLQTSLTDAFTAYQEAIAKIQAEVSKQLTTIDSQIADLQAKIASLLAMLAQLQALANQQTAAPIVPTTGANRVSSIYNPGYAGWNPYRVAAGDISSTTDTRLGNTITINASTNASAQSIANDVGWAIRTSSDVNYGGYTVSPSKLAQLK